MYKICSFWETLVSKAQHEIEVGACGEEGKRPQYILAYYLHGDAWSLLADF